jgi:redox-sensitive bicupin YhaK (pirin superfamily)
MIQIIRAGERYHADHGWLSTWHHFSFNDYFDPDNVQFGALRVFNEDIVQPSSGFPPHPHRDMEIVTYVLDGELEHEDNQGNRGHIMPGEVQVMSAGTGIVHAERNPSPATPLHLLQIWVVPRTRGLRPRWEQQRFEPAARRNALLPVVTPVGTPAAGPSRLQIDQDATFLVSALDEGKSLTHMSPAGRRAYLFAISGALEVQEALIETGDQARIIDESTLTLTARKGVTELILISLP